MSSRSPGELRKLVSCIRVSFLGIRICLVLAVASTCLWSQTVASDSAATAFTTLRVNASPSGSAKPKLFQFAANISWRPLLLPPCPPAPGVDLVTNCVDDNPTTPAATRPNTGFEPIIGRPVAKVEPPQKHIQWAPLLFQSVEFLVLEHAFRLATDPGIQYDLFHKPFWYDYSASADHFYTNRWGDGDSFLVNYIGHPIQGAVSGRLLIQNDPQGRTAKFGRSPAYWKSRLKATAWSAVYSAYFEIGPILSEAALGNEGGYTYVPGCGLYPCKGEPGKTYKPPTNNTGWVDFIVTPLVGTGWILLEDAIEREFVDRLAQGSEAWKYRWLRGALSPSQSLANVLAFHNFWYRPGQGEHIDAWTKPKTVHKQTLTAGPSWKNDPRSYMGLQYIAMSLPRTAKAATHAGV